MSVVGVIGMTVCLPEETPPPNIPYKKSLIKVPTSTTRDQTHNSRSFSTKLYQQHHLARVPDNYPVACVCNRHGRSPINGNPPAGVASSNSPAEADTPVPQLKPTAPKILVRNCTYQDVWHGP